MKNRERGYCFGKRNVSTKQHRHVYECHECMLVVLTKFVFVDFMTWQHTRENAVCGLDVEKLCCGISVDHNHVNNFIYPKVLAS